MMLVEASGHTELHYRAVVISRNPLSTRQLINMLWLVSIGRISGSSARHGSDQRRGRRSTTSRQNPSCSPDDGNRRGQVINKTARRTTLSIVMGAIFGRDLPGRMVRRCNRKDELASPKMSLVLSETRHSYLRRCPRRHWKAEVEKGRRRAATCFCDETNSKLN
ncbi:hypothetical protein BR93DRAFT_177637 [Coniochaeta sp. PMI_546]|nr:hypothetical protein BR93DRAFT_177637 [Coniochaeta sp. PMI_546]